MSAPGQPSGDPSEDLRAFSAKIAEAAGGILRMYPRPGRVVRHVVLRDDRDERGSQRELAQLEAGGILRITGHDQGAGVSEFFGEDLTSYEWVYVVRPDRILALVRLLGGAEGDDVLAVLAGYHERHGGRISAIMKHPDVAAEFSNWHS
jgi:hypothetical protein